MGIHSDRARGRLDALLQERSADDLERRLEPRRDDLPPHVPKDRELTPEITDRRWHLLGDPPEIREMLLDPQTAEQMRSYERNVENFIGTVKVPIGLAGPLRVNGLFAQGDYYLPLATTEAALVASYNRGAQIVSDAGGCAAMLLNEGVSRAPGFAFRDLKEAGRFVSWATSQIDRFREIAESTTRHGELVDMKITVDGNNVYLSFEMTTGDAAGQNMVTFATNAIREYIERESPVRPQYGFLEANLSGDKKASVQSFQAVRGRKVSAAVSTRRRSESSSTGECRWWAGF
jgi:hydroxymethylglutaryl-CoA reductase (NADPH)